MRRRPNRRNRAGNIGELPYGYEAEAEREIGAAQRDYASELNELERALGRPIMFGATAVRDSNTGSTEMVLTFDGTSALPSWWASPAPFIEGALWMLRELMKNTSGHGHR